LAIGCSGSALRWFKSYLTDGRQRVVYQKMITEWKGVGRGVPQGSCLSPLQLNIIVRELPQQGNAEATQFADDLTNSAADKNPLVVKRKLTESCDAIKTFCDEHELIINVAKMQLILFKSPSCRLSEDFTLTLDSHTVTAETSVKLLGLTLDHHLTMSNHIDATVHKVC